MFLKRDCTLNYACTILAEVYMKLIKSIIVGLRGQIYHKLERWLLRWSYTRCSLLCAIAKSCCWEMLCQTVSIHPSPMPIWISCQPICGRLVLPPQGVGRPQCAFGWFYKLCQWENWTNSPSLTFDCETKDENSDTTLGYYATPKSLVSKACSQWRLWPHWPIFVLHSLSELLAFFYLFWVKKGCPSELNNHSQPNLVQKVDTYLSLSILFLVRVRGGIM